MDYQPKKFISTNRRKSSIPHSFIAVGWILYVLLLPLHLFSSKHCFGLPADSGHHAAIEEHTGHHHAVANESGHHHHDDQHSPHYSVDHDLSFTLKKAYRPEKINVVVISMPAVEWREFARKPFPRVFDEVRLKGKSNSIPQNSRAPPLS